jgi:hypothetical protein
MKVKMILPALVEAKSPFWHRLSVPNRRVVVLTDIGVVSSGDAAFLCSPSN